MALKFFQRRPLAKQLGDPSGLMGSVVANKLNQRNRNSIAGAVSALACTGSESVADIGFGGGLGLELRMEAVGGSGQVHGVEPSASMVARAKKAFGADVANGRLVLHEGTMDRLPWEMAN